MTDRTCPNCACPIPGPREGLQGLRTPTQPPTPADPLADLRAPLEPVAPDLLCVADLTGERCDLHRRPMTTCRALIRRLLREGGT